MSKLNDLMLNMLSNLNFGIADFLSVGLTIDNTSLETEDAYKLHSMIKDNPLFKKQDGSFDDVKFHNFYTNAQQALTLLADLKYNENLLKTASFHRDNIFAPVEQRRKGPEFKFIQIPNPDRETSSKIRLGQWQESPLSQSEIAQSQKVLANPNEAYDKDGNLDESKAIWHDAPNDSWLGDYWDTRVLATWDQDGEHIDPITKLKIKHLKGLAKLNSNGTYYYENLSGRSIYGKQVLNRFDHLTSEDSAWNKYDFFDSDDKELKSILGTTMKNLALVGSMYIPYVGPLITGISLATQGAGLLGTLGKMFTGSESPVFSEMEGWALQWSRLNAKTDYAKLNTWCWENFIGLVGDSIAQFKEQRVLFEKVPAAFKGKYGFIDKNFDKEAAISKLANETKIPLAKLALEGLMTKALEQNAVNTLKATADIDSYIKGYYKIGDILAKTYMTGITVADTYGEAKEAGASDFEATMLTLGYGAAEAALLNTGLGEWLFPELRYNKMHQKAVLNTLTKVQGITNEVEHQLASKASQAAKDSIKQNYAKKLFNLGKQACQDLWTAQKSIGNRTISNAIANASGEGFEEVSEELLADFSKGCFNTIKYLREGKEGFLDTIWDGNNFKKDIDWKKEIIDRYGMNFVGGFVGGGIAGFNIDLVKAIKSLDNMSYNQAMQEAIYMIRNKEDGNYDKFMKMLDKTTIGDPSLSATKYTTNEAGEMIPLQAEGDDNQDFAAKQMVKTTFNFIEDVLNTNGINMSDKSFLKSQLDLLGDLKYTMVLNNATSIGRMLLRYNTLCGEIIELSSKTVETPKTDTEKRLESETSEIESKVTENYKKLLQEKIKEKDDLLKGKLTGEYIDAALFELTPMISGKFLTPSYHAYVEAVTGKKYDTISEPEHTKYKLEYETWKASEKGSLALVASKIFKKYVTESADVIKNHAQEYENAKANPVLKSIIDFYDYGMLDKALMALGFEGAGAERFLEALQELANNQEGSFVYTLLSNITDKMPEVNVLLEEQLQIRQQINDGTILDGNAKLKENSLKLNQLFNDEVYKHLDDIINPLLKQGWVNSEIKSDITKAIKYEQNDLLLRINALLATIDEIEQTGFTEEDLDEQDRLKEEQKILIKRSNDLQNTVDKIKDLPQSPIQQSLNNFSLVISGKPTNITELNAKINEALNPVMGDLTSFNMGDNIIEQIDEALNVMEAYRIALDSAATDNGDLENLFGFAHTVNLLNKKLGTENYEELPEIDSKTAVMLKLDLMPFRNQLLFAKEVILLNQGAKLTQLNKAAVNRDFILFHKFKTQVLPTLPEEDKNKLEELISSFEILNSFDPNNKQLNLNKEKRAKLQKETILFENTIYDIFNKNIDNEDFLISVLNPKNLLGMYKIPKESFDENSNDINDASFVWHLATRTALKAGTFYREYGSIIDPEAGIAPISPLVMAVYMNYASVLNGKVFEKFFEAYRKAIKQDWNADHTDENEVPISKELYRLNIIQNMGVEVSGEYALDEYADWVLLHIKTPKYLNITFTEGDPGTGKTAAVLKSTVELLKKFHNNDPILDNVWIIHGADSSENNENPGGNKLKNNLGLPNATVMNRKEFMEKVVVDWKDVEKDSEGNYNVPENKYELNDEKEIRSSNKIVKDANPPTLILIDELTNFSLFDLDDINKFAEENGIQILGAGDTELSGIKGLYELTAKTGLVKTNPDGKVEDRNRRHELLLLFATNFIHTPKLGVNMRQTCNQKTRNLNKFKVYMRDPHHNRLTESNALTAALTDNGLFGDVIFKSGDFPEGTNSEVLNKEIKGTDKTVGLLIDIMVQTTGDEPIALITNNSDTQFADFLKNKYGDKIVVFKGTSSQGHEFKYTIMDIDNGLDFDGKLTELFILDLWTGITRSQLGNIVILRKSEYAPSSRVIDDIQETTEFETTTINETLDPTIIKSFSKEVKDLYAKVTEGETESSLYIPKKLPETPKVETEEEKKPKPEKNVDPSKDEEPKEELPLISPEVQAILNNIPQDLHETIIKNIEEAKKHPNTSAWYFPTDKRSDIKWGDVFLLKDGTYGVVSGLSPLTEDLDDKYEIILNDGSKKEINASEVQEVINKPAANLGLAKPNTNIEITNAWLQLESLGITPASTFKIINEAGVELDEINTIVKISKPTIGSNPTLKLSYVNSKGTHFNVDFIDALNSFSTGRYKKIDINHDPAAEEARLRAEKEAKIKENKETVEQAIDGKFKIGDEIVIIEPNGYKSTSVILNINSDLNTGWVELTSGRKLYLSDLQKYFEDDSIMLLSLYEENLQLEKLNEIANKLEALGIKNNTQVKFEQAGNPINNGIIHITDNGIEIENGGAIVLNADLSELDNFKLQPIRPELHEETINPEDLNIENEVLEKEKLLQDTLDPTDIRNKVEEVEGRAKVFPLFYTTFTFESGVALGNLNEPPKQTGSNKINNLRIDSVNGLLNLDKSLGKEIRTLGEYLDMIGELRGIILDAQSYEDLNESLTYFIQDYFEDDSENPILGKVNSTFGYRMTYPNHQEKGNVYDGYIKPTEDVLYVGHDQSPKSIKSQRSYIGLLIGIEGIGDVIELPIMNLSNPISLIRSKDNSGNYLFPEIAETFPTTYESSAENLKEFRDIYNLPENKSIKTKYNTIFKLIDLYLDNEETFIPLKDFKLNGQSWVLGRDMTFYGPRIISKTKGKLFSQGGIYEDPDYAYEGQFVDLPNLLEHPGIIVSDLLYSKTDTIEGEDGSNIIVNGESDIIQKGHPFILYTFCKDIEKIYGITGPNELEKAYKYQLEHPEAPQRIKLAYVLPPKASLKEFVLYQTLNKDAKREHTKVGNDLDGYKIVRSLFNNPEFVLNFINKGYQHSPESLVNIVNKVLEDLKEYIKDAKTPQELNNKTIDFLNKDLDLGDVYSEYADKWISGIRLDTMRNKEFFNRVVAALVYPGKVNLSTFVVEHEENPEIISFIELYADTSTLRFHPDALYKHDDFEEEVEGFYKIAHEGDYSIKDLNEEKRYYQVFGKIDSDVMTTDIDPLLNYLLNYKKENEEVVTTTKTGKKITRKTKREESYLNRQITAKKERKVEKIDESETETTGKTILDNLKYKLRNRTLDNKVRGGQDGWKIRLVVKNPNTGLPFNLSDVNNPEYFTAAKPILDWLQNYFSSNNSTIGIIHPQNGGIGHYVFTENNIPREPFKFLAGGEVGESDFTIYLGSLEDVEKFISDVEKDPAIKNLIADSTNTQDVQFNSWAHGRVEGRAIGFDGYGLSENLINTLLQLGYKIGDTIYKDDLNEIQLGLDTTTGKFEFLSINSDGSVHLVDSNQYNSYEDIALIYNKMNHIRATIALSIYGEYIGDYTQLLEKLNQPIINPNASKYSKFLEEDIEDLLQLTDEELKLKVYNKIELINSDDSPNIALMIDGIPLVLNTETRGVTIGQTLLFNSEEDYSNNPFSPKTDFKKDGEGNVNFFIMSGNKSYNAVYKPNLYMITFYDTSNKSPINEYNFEAIQEGFNKVNEALNSEDEDLLESALDLIDDYPDIFTAKSLDSLIEALSHYEIKDYDRTIEGCLEDLGIDLHELRDLMEWSKEYDPCNLKGIIKLFDI